ncbi:hypothetical protein [Rhodospirillum sp. A1_3_36]|uniref:hypothetical protein n=1 Tax=Rhodospirillum sp. A1_3_36 TaxID=3391666 RepID=UPI0039A6191C
MSFAILDVAIGLIFTFLTLSLMATVCQELLAQTFQLRGKTLWAFLAKLLGGVDSDLTKALRDHPRINTLTAGNRLPEAIPATTFAKALAEMMADPDKQAIALQGPLAPFLKPYLDDLSKFQEEMTQWYNQTMTSVSSWYASKAKLFLFLIGFALSAALNVSALSVGEALWVNKDLRDIITAQAESYTQGHQNGPEKPLVKMETVEELRSSLESLNLPIGWENKDLDEFWENWTWLHLTVGWLLTALAASLGSQFWYESLRRLVALRTGLGNGKSQSAQTPASTPPTQN